MSAALAAMAAMAQNRKPIKRIQLGGGATQGRLISEVQPPQRKNETVVRENKGDAYAVKFKNQLDDETQEEESWGPGFHDQKGLLPSLGKRVTAVEDATSLGTHDVGTGMATISEDLNAVYHMYDFNPEVEVSPTLLIHEFKNDILRQIDVHNVVIIKGPTGCGKTTQVPLFILEEARERNIYCNIIVTQPRRIAATSVAKRVCKERGWNLGTIVGYQIGLERNTSRDTRLTYVTAGVLLNKLVNRQFDDYTHIIVDEVHERECETDFMLIILKRLIKRAGNRKKLILMSATMASSKFSDYFTRTGSEGRLVIPPLVDLPHERKFDVKICYRDSLPAAKGEWEPLDLDRPCIPTSMYGVAAALLRMLQTFDGQNDKDSVTGAVLVFLPGIVEIETMSKVLQNHPDGGFSQQRKKWFICPVHSSMSFDEQMKVFERPPTGAMKVILATNIAESSITVPDVRYVVDFCLTKRQVQNKDTSYSSLQLCWESKSQAEQRAGRAGRTMPGSVYRLVDKNLYDEFDEDSPPEILRCPLDQLVLKTKQLDMGPPVAILGRAMDPPDLTNIERTILNLKELGALSLFSRGEYDEQDGDLTFTGQVMAQLPIDTQLSKLILIGHMFSVVRECVSMACCMSGRNIFTAPLNKKMESYNTKIGWDGGSKSDPLTALNLFKSWKDKKTQGKFGRSGGESEQQWANRNFAQLKSLKEVEKLELEVVEHLKKLGIVDHRADRLKNSSNIVQFILKVCLAGAFYPNFFLHNQIDEEAAVKTLGKRDPCRTVYFRNFPQDQPGPLYRDSIKALLEGCGSGIKVQFDGSSKVFVEFESSMIQHEDLQSKVENDIPIPGRVMKAVYRAVKMRHLDMPMAIPMLTVGEARRRAKRIFGTHLYPSTGCYGNEKNDPAMKNAPPINRMPTLNQTLIRLTITHVVDPSNFYGVLDNHKHAGLLIQQIINENEDGTIVDLHPPEVTPGKLCLAKYKDPITGGVDWYRAKIIAVAKRCVKVQYIDYGNYDFVNADELKGFGPRLMNSDTIKQAPLCVRCRLAEIQPVCLKGSGPGEWSRVATDCFMKSCNFYECDAKIYSVVDDTMAVLVYPSKRRPANFDLPLEESVNYMLVADGHANFVEEPFLSKENHERRESIAARKEEDAYYIGATEDHHYYMMDHKEFEPPSRDECRVLKTLYGPFSPLEMTAYPLTRKCAGKTVTVDWNSINSVLINENAVDNTTRLIVAGSVNQNLQNSSLTLRNTTLMPCIRGLSGILAIMFAPKAELRVNTEMTHYTGALCGLGCDENGISYDQENDVEIIFDSNIDLDDIEKINKIRFWMERILCRRSDQLQEDHAASESGLLDVQDKCLSYLLSLFSKTRDPLGTEYCGPKYEWNQVPEEYLLNPLKNDRCAQVYQLLWGVSFNEPSQEEELKKMKKHLAKIRSYITGGVQMKSPVICMLCQTYSDNVRTLDFHVKSQYHRTRENMFFGEPHGKVDRMNEEVDQYHRRIRSYVQ